VNIRYFPLVILVSGCAAAPSEPQVAPPPVIEVAAAYQPPKEQPKVIDEAPPDKTADAEAEEPEEATDDEGLAQLFGQAGSVGVLGVGGGTGFGSGSGSIGTIRPGGAGVGGGSTGMLAGPRVTTSQAAVSGALPKELVARVVRANISRVRYCYEKQLLNEPTLEGRLTIRFVIDGNGTVGSAVATSSLGSDIDTCVANVFRTMTFPKPKGNRKVVVNYPITFSNPGATP
jgi:hypothetical protein